MNTNNDNYNEVDEIIESGEIESIEEDICDNEDLSPDMGEDLGEATPGYVDQDR